MTRKSKHRMKSDDQVLTEIAEDGIRFGMDSVGVTRHFTVRAWKDFIGAVTSDLFGGSKNLARSAESDVIEDTLRRIREYAQQIIRHDLIYLGSDNWSREYFGWKNLAHFYYITDLLDTVREIANACAEEAKVGRKVGTP